MTEGDPASDKRWPRWVYGIGQEPDYRFTLANERTFLAWIRTATALIAGGLALFSLDLGIPMEMQRGIAVMTVCLGIACAIASWTRWASAERAMRQGRPLPASRFALIVTVVLVVLAIVIVTVMAL